MAGFNQCLGGLAGLIFSGVKNIDRLAGYGNLPEFSRKGKPMIIESAVKTGLICIFPGKIGENSSEIEELFLRH
ncbi:MAG: hypothetical protein JW847_05630 [Candidatus Omnitrophica bacterium]|nr:hypothetical protein [Candidatus Omnitrophota bacterium]